MAGISKQRQQGGFRGRGSRSCAQLEGRQAGTMLQHQLSAPTSSEAALPVQQANRPKAQPPASLLQSGMNKEANLETRNQAGA